VPNYEKKYNRLAYPLH